jgi:hypothetical protein
MTIATKRTSNYLDHEETMFAQFGDVTIYAAKQSGYATEDYDPELGEYIPEWHPDFYTLSSHQGMMPAFHDEEFVTIEAISAKMKYHTGDLRKWRVVKYDDAGNPIDV